MSFFIEIIFIVIKIFFRPQVQGKGELILLIFENNFLIKLTIKTNINFINSLVYF